MLNERVGQFYKAVHCKVTRQLKTEAARNGLKNVDDLALKQNMCREILVFFGVLYFTALSVQFHSN